MNPESWPESPDTPERLPSTRLMGYLRGKFYDAVQVRTAEVKRDDTSDNGAFIQRQPLESGHALTRGSRRIVLKPPHPNDLPGFYCEVFALRFSDTPAETNEQFITEASHFLVRDYAKGRPGPFWLIDENGVHSANLDHVDPDNIIGIDATSSSLSALERAEEFLHKYKQYNIVATTE